MKLSKEIIEKLECLNFSDEDLRFLTFCRGLNFGSLQNLVIKDGKPFEVQRAIETTRFYKFN